jgi:nucleoid DNA-binding protein
MNKQTTIRAVAGKTGMTYFEIQTVLEAILDVWGEALVQGDQITIQDFLTIKVTEMKTHQRGKLRYHTPNTSMRKIAYRIDARLSQKLKDALSRKR